MVLKLSLCSFHTPAQVQHTIRANDMRNACDHQLVQVQVIPTIAAEPSQLPVADNMRTTAHLHSHYAIYAHYDIVYVPSFHPSLG